MNFGSTLQDAVALVKSGRLYEAVDKWAEGLDEQTLRDRLLVLGEAFNGLGMKRESLDLILRALKLDAQNIRCLCAAGEAYQGCNLLEDALACFFKATQLDPGIAEAWSGMGYVFLRSHKTTEALSCLQKAFEKQPADADISNRMGLVFLAQDNPMHASRWFLNSISLKPELAHAWGNLAVAWRRSNQIELAGRAIKNALKIEPASPVNWLNLGVLHQEKNQIEDALFAYRKAISLDENFHAAHVNEGIALLLKGDLQEGWKKYEYRWFLRENQDQRHMKLPFWKGNQSLAGKTILLHSDQGFGDTIQCLRFVSELFKLGAIIHVAVNPVLVDIAAQVAGVVTAVSLRQAGEIFDFQCPFLSLPFACKAGFETLQKGVPYLRPSAEAREKWRLFRASGEKLKVALVWRGNAQHENDHNRSLALAAIKPLLELEKCDFVNLQWDLCEEEKRVVTDHTSFRDVTPQISTFDDTAAVMEHMDLIISVDTAAAHLAGALGKPVWILLPFAPDWRWLLGRVDSPWYPTARLFRQPERGNWSSVVDEVALNLRVLLNGDTASSKF